MMNRQAKTNRWIVAAIACAVLATNASTAAERDSSASVPLPDQIYFHPALLGKVEPWTVSMP